MCQMTCVRLQHCRFTLSTEGAARRRRSEAVREGLQTADLHLTSKGVVHPPCDADGGPPSAPLALLFVPPDSSSAPYEGSAVDGKRHNGVNSEWTTDDVLWVTARSLPQGCR